MSELDHMNPDLMRAELAYRREQLTIGHRDVPSRLSRWYRSRRTARSIIR
jgi:hypothetical protein